MHVVFQSFFLEIHIMSGKVIFDSDTVIFTVTGKKSFEKLTEKMTRFIGDFIIPLLCHFTK